MAKLESIVPSSVDNEFAAKYARQGYQYGYAIERYEGEEQSDVEKRVDASGDYKEWYIDWQHVKPRQSGQKVMTGVQAAEIRQGTMSKVLSLRTVQKLLGSHRISQNKKIIEIGTVFYK